jgi:hypothetical protein
MALGLLVPGKLFTLEFGDQHAAQQLVVSVFTGQANRPPTCQFFVGYYFRYLRLVSVSFAAGRLPGQVLRHVAAFDFKKNPAFSTFVLVFGNLLPLTLRCCRLRLSRRSHLNLLHFHYRTP